MNDQQRAAMQIDSWERRLDIKYPDAVILTPAMILEVMQAEIIDLREALAQPQDKGENNDVSAMAGVEQNRLGSGAKDGEVAQPLYTTPPVVPQGDPVAYLCGKCVDNFTVDGYETCEQGDYGSFPVYRHPPSVEVETIDGHSKHWWQHEINNARAEGYERGFNSGKEATKEKVAKVCDDLYKHDRKDSGYDEGWNDALDIAEQVIRSMK